MSLKSYPRSVFLWAYWKPFAAVAQRMGAASLYRTARAAAAAANALAREKRRHLELEYDCLFGPGHDADRDRAVTEAFFVLAANELEVLTYPALSPDNIASFVRLAGVDHLEEGLARKKGVMLWFGHFGANQMIMPALGHRGYAMSQLSAPATVWKDILPEAHDGRIAAMALARRWEHEKSLPVEHINVFGSLKKAFMCLKRNEILGVAIDGGGGKNRVAVDFFDRKAFVSTGPAEIALRTGCTVLPAFVIRDPAGPSTLVMEPPLEITNGGDPHTNATDNLGRFARRLEAVVTRYPGHYLNFLALRRFMHTAVNDPPFFVDN